MRADGPLRRPLAWLEGRAKPLHSFLTAQDGSRRLWREVVTIALLIVVLLGGLWTYTGQQFPGQSPVVVVESGSMMHCANGIDLGRPGAGECASSSFGRLGTIDPGDLILVKDVDGARDIHPLGEGGRGRYGKDGDVIIYHPHGRTDVTPIIHRALFWMEVHDNGTLSIPSAGIRAARVIDAETLEGLGVGEIDAAGATASGGFLDRIAQDCHGWTGYVTRGDNNHHVDVGLGSFSIGSPCLVREEWVIGKARGEIPWIGALKLFLTDSARYKATPGDVKAFMWGTIALFVVGPFLVDRSVAAWRAARGAGADEETAGASDRAPDAPVESDRTGKGPGG